MIWKTFLFIDKLDMMTVWAFESVFSEEIETGSVCLLFALSNWIRDIGVFDFQLFNIDTSHSLVVELKVQ
jgi:hypothetical protein